MSSKGTMPSHLLQSCEGEKVVLKNLMVALFLLVTPAFAHASPVKVGDISLDLRDGFKTSESKRGVLTESPDSQTYLWIEAYLDSELDTLISEHDDYWKEKDVKLNGEPDTTRRTLNNDVVALNMDFKKATWKGDPTVIRHYQLGPFGSENKRILMTLWATPKSDAEFSDAFQKIADSVVFQYKK